MNAQLSHQMAQLHQQDLYRQAGQARAAREIASDGRFTALCRKLMNTPYRRAREQAPAQVPAGRPVVGVITKA